MLPTSSVTTQEGKRTQDKKSMTRRRVGPQPQSPSRRCVTTGVPEASSAWLGQIAAPAQLTTTRRLACCFLREPPVAVAASSSVDRPCLRQAAMVRSASNTSKLQASVPLTRNQAASVSPQQRIASSPQAAARPSGFTSASAATCEPPLPSPPCLGRLVLDPHGRELPRRRP